VRALPAILITLILVPVFALAGRAEEPAQVSDAAARQAVERFEREFRTEDIDLKLDAVTALGKVDHPRVARALLRLLGHGDLEVRVEAMRALASQTRATRSLTGKLRRYLDRGADEARLVAATVRTIAAHDLRTYEDDLVDLLVSPEDEVVIAALDVLGSWKCRPALRKALLLWEAEPEQGAALGSRTVYAGSDELAKAKWKELYGGRTFRSRPEVVRAVRRNVNRILGREEGDDGRIETPEQLRVWIREHRRELR
jgi:HEAT repeat protein